MKSPVQGHVLRRPQHVTSGRQAVPSCPPDLLVVGLHLFRGPVVDDFADVGLVNAHAKSHGGDNTLEEKQKHVKQVIYIYIYI